VSYFRCLCHCDSDRQDAQKILSGVICRQKLADFWGTYSGAARGSTVEAESKSMDHCGNSCAGGLHGGARHLHRQRRAPAHRRQPRRQFRPRNMGADQLSHIERHRSSSGRVGIQRYWPHNEIVKWTPGSAPADWTSTRDKWLHNHWVRTWIGVLAFGCTLFSTLLITD